MLDVQTVTMVTEVRMMRTSKVWIKVSSLHFCLKGSRCKVNELLQQRIELYNIPMYRTWCPLICWCGRGQVRAQREATCAPDLECRDISHQGDVTQSFMILPGTNFILPLLATSAEKCGQRVLCFSCSDNIYLRFATHGWVSCESLSTEANEVMKS